MDMLTDRAPHGMDANIQEDLTRQILEAAYLIKHQTVLSRLLTPGFKDHDFLLVPKIFSVHPDRSDIRERWSLLRFNTFLKLPTVDITFHIEELFGSRNSVAFRMFGAGSVWLRRVSPHVERASVNVTTDEHQTRGVEQDDSEAGDLREVLVKYSSVGILHFRNDLPSERYGSSEFLPADYRYQKRRVPRNTWGPYLADPNADNADS